MPVDYETLGRQLVRALRGKRSQVAFSRRLGFRTNVVYAWESGRRWPTAATLLEAASKSRIDVRAVLGSFFPTPPSWLEEIDPRSRAGVARLLSELRAKIPILEVAKRAGRSRYAVSRWLSGDAEPRLPDFLRLVQACSLRLFDFVALFVDPEALPAAAEGWRMMQAHRQAAYDVPWVAAVLRALELEDYRKLRAHKRGWIASRIGITREEEDRCLDVLVRGGQIREEDGRWVIGESISVDTRQDKSAELRLKGHWAKVGVDRLRLGAPGLFSFNVFNVSEEDLEKLRELHRSYYRTMRSIIAASAPSQRVVVANVQLFALDRAPDRDDKASRRVSA